MPALLQVSAELEAVERHDRAHADPATRACRSVSMALTRWSQASTMRRRGVTGLNFFSPRGELETALPYRELRQQAVDLAPRLAGCDARARRPRGHRRRDLARLRHACSSPASMPGSCRCPLPLCINIGGHDAYVERLRGMLVAAGARLAVAPADLMATLEEAAHGHRRCLVATAAEIAAGWPAIGTSGRRSAPTSPATSSIPRAAPASRAACWSRSGRSPPTRARSPCTAWRCAPTTAAPPGCRSTTTWAWSAAA